MGVGIPYGWAPGVRGGYPGRRGRQLLAVTAALLLFACAGGREQARRDAQTSYKLGVAFLAEGRPGPALRELSKAEVLNPEEPEIRNALGLAYWAGREHGQAAEKFLAATRLKPDYSEAWNNLGALYLDQGRFGEAVPALEAALRNVFYGTRERALANLGWALHRLGRSAEGERRLREAVEIAPGFPLARKNLGAVLQDRGDHRAALGEFDEALRFLPNDADTHLRRGLTLQRLGDRPGARAALERAWRLAPDSDVGRSAKNYLDFME